MDEGLMDKGLYERLVEDVLENIKLKGIDVAKKNSSSSLSAYGQPSFREPTTREWLMRLKGWQMVLVSGLLLICLPVILSLSLPPIYLHLGSWGSTLIRK